jgi:energy-coupling factor transporter ATP-binding protein EcfA2
MSPRARALLRVADLTVQYPGRPSPALTRVSLGLDRGERILLLGPSGAGKTTFLLSLAGIIPQVIYAEATGTIDVDGVDARRTPPALLARSVGLLFQDPDAQLCMPTVEEEVAFGLENLEVAPDEMEPRIRGALDAVGLTPRRTLRIDRLSGGLKQRLALAAILAMAAPVLLLDEPTAHLDPRGTRGFFDVLERVTPAGFVLVEHKLEHVVPLITRVVALSPEGRVLVEGTPATMFGQHASLLDAAGIWLPPATRVAHAAGVGGNILTLEHLKATMGSSADTAHRVLRVLPSPRPPVTPGAAAISVSGLSYTYSRGPQALHDVTLRVAEGDFLALVGSNGSGKTTLALHLVGILQPPRASVTILGRDIATTLSWDIPSLIGYVFQNPEHQFITDTVLGEVRYTLRRRGLGESDATAEAHEVLTRYGLAPVADLHPYQLSQGAKRRLSVLTVLAAAPRVLVLDEPTFGQDARTNHALLAEMVRLNEQGLTILMITHDMDAVGQYARSVAIMHEGRITHQGAVANLPRYRDRLQEAGLELPFAMRVRTLAGAA